MNQNEAQEYIKSGNQNINKNNFDQASCAWCLSSATKKYILNDIGVNYE